LKLLTQLANLCKRPRIPDTKPPRQNVRDKETTTKDLSREDSSLTAARMENSSNSNVKEMELNAFVLTPKVSKSIIVESRVRSQIVRRSSLLLLKELTNALEVLNLVLAQMIFKDGSTMKKPKLADNSSTLDAVEMETTILQKLLVREDVFQLRSLENAILDSSP